MQIHEFAQKSCLSEKTVRFYESIGVLPPARRARNGYREFDERHLERARFVSGARSIDLSLDDISEILAIQDRREAPCRTLLDLIEQKAEQIEERIRLLKQMKVELRQLHKLGETFPTDDIDGKNCIYHLVSEHSNVSVRN